MLTEVRGVRVGHWTAEPATTGCTVVLLPEGTVGSGEVRGGAPASREFSLLEPTRLVERLDAVVLTGGSAFGLAVADGVMSWCAEQSQGYETAGGRVPIVVACALYDLEGNEGVVPGPAQGRAAAEAARPGPYVEGRVGAGAGARIDKWRGLDRARHGGLGSAAVRSGDLVVAALVAVNAAGTLDDGSVAAEVRSGSFVAPAPPSFSDGDEVVTNTTIGTIVTNAGLSKVDCHVVAQRGHDGMGRALMPAHTSTDGDALVVAATGEVDAARDVVGLLATVAVEDAIRTALDASTP